MTPQELKNSILQLAIQGKLVEQRPEEGTAEELFAQIQEEKQRLIAEKKIKKEKKLPEITEDEKPFEIPESWKWCRINQISYLNSGGQYQENESGIPYIKVADMNLPENIIEIQTSSRFVKCSESDLVYPSSIIFPKRGGAIATNKKRKVLKIPICIDSNTMAMSLFFKEIFDYVYVWFISIDLGRLSTGTSVPQINNKDIEPLLVPLPPLAEQKRIVAKIEELLPYIDRYEQAWSKLEQFNSRFPEDMKKSLLQYAIQGKLVGQRPEEGTAEELFSQIQEEKQRLIAEKKIKKEKTLPEITEDEKPFDIPQSWKWVRLNYIAESIVDCPHSTPKYLDVETEYCTVDTNCINEAGTITKWRYVDSNTYMARIARLTPQKDDIVYTREGSICRAAMLPDEKKICLGQRVMLIRCADGVFPQFLRRMLMTPMVISKLTEQQKGIGAKHVNVSDVCSLILPLPPLAEQKRIVEKLEQLLPLCEKII